MCGHIWTHYHQIPTQIMAQVFTMIPEPLLREVQKLKMVKEVWDAICAKHKTMVLTVKVNMHCYMYEFKCQDNANICMHLETLM